MDRTTTGMSEGGRSSGDFYRPPQPKLMAETDINNPVCVGEWVNPYGIRVEYFGTDPKGKYRYPGDRYDVGSVKGGGYSDRYPY